MTDSTGTPVSLADSTGTPTSLTDSTGTPASLTYSTGTPVSLNEVISGFDQSLPAADNCNIVVPFPSSISTTQLVAGGQRISRDTCYAYVARRDAHGIQLNYTYNYKYTYSFFIILIGFYVTRT